MSETFRCRDCGETIQGDSQLCVACFRKKHKPCPYCMRFTGRRWMVRHSNGKRNEPVNCKQCGNERWVLAEGEA